MMYDYISSILGVPVARGDEKAVEEFLADHMSKHPKTNDARLYFVKESYRYGTVMMGYEFDNNFGICMLKKHKEDLLNKFKFDFDKYYHYLRMQEVSIDKKAFEEFVKKSDEVR